MPNGGHWKKEEFERLEKPLRDIDSLIERFAREHDDLVMEEPNYHDWPSHMLSLRRRAYSDIFRRIGVTLEFDQKSADHIPKRPCTYAIYVDVYEDRDSGRPFDPDNRSWLDRYWASRTIREGMEPPLNPQQVYQLLEEAYKIAKSFKKEDLKKVPEKS